MMTKPRITLLAALLLGGAVARGDAPPYNADRWLHWHNNFPLVIGDLNRCHVPKSEGADWDDAMRRIGRELAAMAPTPPGDLFGQVRGSILIDGACDARPFRGTLEFNFLKPKDVERVPSVTRAGQVWLRGSSSGGVQIQVNRLMAIDVLDWLNDSPEGPQVGVALRPAAIGGFPVYNRYLVIAADGHAPPYLPVPMERVLTAWIAKLNRDVAQYTAADAELAKTTGQRIMTDTINETREQIAATKAKLAAMTPAQRSAPAYSTQFGIATGEFADQPGPDAVAVLRQNPQYFDPKLPRSAAQILEVDISNLSAAAPPSPKDQAEQPTAAMSGYVFKADWHRVAKLLR